MIVLGLNRIDRQWAKSTTARQVPRGKVLPVHDSDEAVHRIYAGPAAPLIRARLPGHPVVDGVVESAAAFPKR